MELKTPLYDTHVKYGAKIVEFGGYLMPVQYGTGVIAEHMAVRTACGLFDVSHMGEIICKGDNALAQINHILTNDFSGMADGQARYSPMCNEKGGVVDDLIVYKVNDGEYLLVVNASNKDKDFAWVQAHRIEGASFEDISDSVAQLALQGPKAEEILRKLARPEDIPETYYTCVFNADIRGMKCMISQTGYTGEDGYEIYFDAADAVRMWELLLETGRDEGLIPCGLGARDTLRLEAGMPLYGHEMTDDISPRETGLGIFVKMKKDEFVGKEALEAKGVPTVKRIGLRATGRGIIREGCDLYVGDTLIGRTTSGTFCPYFKQSLAMAIVDKQHSEAGPAVEADVRGRRVAAEIVATPFYRKSSK